jgi:hypothetical protein
MPSVGTVGHPDDAGMGWGMAGGVVGEAAPLGKSWGFKWVDQCAGFTDVG